jgi:hypothetical protein
MLGKSLNNSLCDVFAKIYLLPKNSEQQKWYVKELSSLISVIQDFSKNNTTVYSYDLTENKQKTTNIDIKQVN